MPKAARLIYATRLLYTRRRTPNTYTGKGGSKRD
jgi:hypothetical protein